jgi:hypothetical protein
MRQQREGQGGHICAGIGSGAVLSSWGARRLTALSPGGWTTWGHHKQHVSTVAIDGISKRTTRVSSSRPTQIVEPIWTKNLQAAADHGGDGEGEHQTRGGHHAAGAGHGADSLRLEPGVDLFFEPGSQQQVVVGSDGQQDDDRHQHDKPVDFDAEEVLPDEHGQSEGCGDGAGGGADDD